TANAEAKGAEQAGQRCRSSPPQAGQAGGSSSSKASNQRCAPPQSTQNAAQSPSTLRRSSRSQSAALPTCRTITAGYSSTGMATARVAEPGGSLGEAKEWGLDREDLLGIYRNMLTTRGVEERGHILYRQGKIPGSFYTGRGNEAASVGVATAMGP